jgi:hypothetical protein
MPHSISSKTVMSHAWELFRKLYNYGGKFGLSFKSIGRNCFASCLRKAWALLRQKMQEESLGANHHQERITKLERELLMAGYMDDFRSMRIEEERLRTLIAQHRAAFERLSGSTIAFAA